MKVPIACPNGEYREGMKIYCTKTDNWCGNQYFKQCKGWWALTDNAQRCPVRYRTAENLRVKARQVR